MREPPLILVVDDNEANVDILVTRLESQGYAVVTARDGEEALEQARLALERAEATVFADPAANAVLLSGSGGRRAITCHQLHDNWLSFERQWQAVP